MNFDEGVCMPERLSYFNDILLKKVDQEYEESGAVNKIIEGQ
jgi:hypothetical protein